jgi:hypothetical protein
MTARPDDAAREPLSADKLCDVDPELAPQMLRALKSDTVDRERLRELTERRRLGLHVSRMELCDGIEALLFSEAAQAATIARLEGELAETRARLSSSYGTCEMLEGECKTSHADRDLYRSLVCDVVAARSIGADALDLAAVAARQVLRGIRESAPTPSAPRCQHKRRAPWDCACSHGCEACALNSECLDCGKRLRSTPSKPAELLLAGPTPSAPSERESINQRRQHDDDLGSDTDGTTADRERAGVEQRPRGSEVGGGRGAASARENEASPPQPTVSAQPGGDEGRVDRDGGLSEPEAPSERGAYSLPALPTDPGYEDQLDALLASKSQGVRKVRPSEREAAGETIGERYAREQGQRYTADASAPPPAEPRAVTCYCAARGGALCECTAKPRAAEAADDALRTAVIEHLVAMGPCDDVEADSDASYCGNEACTYCALAYVAQQGARP